MKYFSINYLWKTFLLILPIFANQKKEANSKPMLKNMEFINTYNDFKNHICIHEAGHAINVLKSDFKNDFVKLWIWPSFIDETSMILRGETIHNSEDYTSLSTKQLESTIRITMGGKAAEKLYSIEDDKYVEPLLAKEIDELKKRFSESSNDNYIKISEESLNNIVNNTIFIEKNNAKNIITNNQIEFQKIVETCNLLNIVTKNHTDYILKHKEIPPEAQLKKANMFLNVKNHTLTQETTLSQVEEITTEQTQETTLSQVEEITTEQISWLKELSFIQSLSKSKIEDLKEDEIQVLTKPQINYLSIYDFWNDQQKSWLTTEQIPWMIFNSVVCKTPNEISNIPVEDIKDIELVEIMLLTRPQIKAFNPQQIQSMSSEQKLWFEEQSISSRQKRSNLMFDNVKSTSSFTNSKSISWLTPEQIPALTLHQIKAFTPQQRLWLEIKNNKNNNDMSKENKTWKYWLYAGITTTIGLIIIAGRKLKSNFQKNINEKKILMDDNVKLMIEPDKNINSLNNEFNIKNEINSMDLQSFNKPLSKENYSSL